MYKPTKIKFIILILLIIPLVFKFAEAQTKSSGTEAWEYKTVRRSRVITINGISPEWTPWQSFEEGSTEALPGNLTQQMNRLGAQGWELVTSEVFLEYGDDTSLKGQSRNLIFKRPKH